ncbi:MAG: hypothetical protein AB1453_12620 [Chloroflexota bacterium]|jgi:hypothetical protein
MEQLPTSGNMPTHMIKPGMVTTLGVMTLVSGILNILTGLGITFAVAVSTLGIGLLCAPITFLPGILGVFEILYAIKILANPPTPVQFSQTIAILEILTILVGNVVALIVGILALVFYNDPQVREYFARINAQPAVAES